MAWYTLRVRWSPSCNTRDRPPISCGRRGGEPDGRLSMDSGSSSGQTGRSDVRQAARFSASRWERNVADQFLGWRTTCGTALERMRLFAEAITRTLRQDGHEFTESGELASKLEPATASRVRPTRLLQRTRKLRFPAAEQRIVGQPEYRDVPFGKTQRGNSLVKGGIWYLSGDRCLAVGLAGPELPLS